MSRYRYYCIHEGCPHPVENQDTGECASHGAARRKEEREANKPRKEPYKIAPRSKKRAAEESQYSKEKREWIAGMPCAVFPELMAVDIHHKKGRVGYADQWAKDRGITLLRDQRYWLPVSREGHNEIELNPQWAKDQGFSLSRLEIIDEEKPTI